MQATRVQDPLEASGTLKKEGSDRSETFALTLGMNTIDVDNVDTNDGQLQWQGSPVRTTSLLPPFGVGPPSHLLTPQSPGNWTQYSTRPAGSPLSSEHLGAGPSHHFTTFRSPSLPENAHLAKAPQREPSLATPKIPSQMLPPPVRVDGVDKARSTDPAWLHSSQIATPSPEVTRTRRASIPNSPSDTESIATPREKRSDSHPYSDNASLAPAPIISPTNSNHPTIFQTLPELSSGKRTSISYETPHNTSPLLSHCIPQSSTQCQDIHELADPFIIQDDGVRKEVPIPKRYPSPPISRAHRRTNGNASPLLHVRSTCHGESTTEKPVKSPTGSSEARSQASPVKTERMDGEYEVAVRLLRPGMLNDAPISHTLTPPSLESARDTDVTQRTPPLEQSAFRTPPRVAGGEMERIRRLQAELADTRMTESEKRRPEYLIRTKRMRDDAEDDAHGDRESALPGLGVTVTPVKGRRLKLYRPVPVSAGSVTLEEDLRPQPEDPELRMPSPPSTVPFMTVPAMSMRAIDWRSPRQKPTSSVIWTDEDELKKQKRLAAFASRVPSTNSRRLKPVEVAGHGRMIVDVTSEETRALAEAGILEIPPPESLDNEVALVTGHGAEWPDSEFPWSLQGQKRHEEEEAERRRRLVWIERFLDRESESEEDDHDVGEGLSAGSLPLDVNTRSHTHLGRGKSVSLKVAPSSRVAAKNEQRLFNAANSDAREVLLSKKYVREVAERIRRRKAAEEEEGIVMCICQGGDDGRPMVRCDECRTWYHLVCMDIKDESELGDEWFCWKCSPSAEETSPTPMFEPTFAPVMPDTPPRTSVGDLPLYQTALQLSPILEIRARAPVSPSVPVNSSRDHDRSPPRRSRAPHPLGEPDDPVRGGPSTPYHASTTDSRLYSTPKLYDEYMGEEYVPFDPTSTPSRGLKFPNPVPITPRRPATWGGQGLFWGTPQVSSQTPSSSARSLAYSLSTIEDSGGPLTSPWSLEDSPVRRPHKTSESNHPFRRLLDSPLTVRGGGNRPHPPGVEESPSARYTHRGKDKDLGELTSRTAAS